MDKIVSKMEEAFESLLKKKEVSLPKEAIQTIHDGMNSYMQEILNTTENKEVRILKDGCFHDGAIMDLGEDGILISTHDIAADIACDIIEPVLDDLDITIPDDERTGDESEARLYGDTYAELTDEFESIVNEHLASTQLEQENELD